MTILYQLAQFNLLQATTTAHKHKDHKLALLISQSATGHRDNRLLLHQQLNDWDKLEVWEVYVHVQCTCVCTLY